MTTACRAYAALAIALPLAAAGCSAQHGGSAPASQSVTASAESTSSAKPAPTTTSLADEMKGWEAVAGEHFTESSQALQQVSDASAAEDAQALGSGCKKLHDANVVGLQRDLPTPDPKLTAELQRMIDDVNIATHACIRFVLAREAVDVQTYQDYLARAVEHLHRAKAVLDADLAPK